MRLFTCVAVGAFVALTAVAGLSHAGQDVFDAGGRSAAAVEPKPPGALFTARLVGSFDVTERFTSVSGIDLKVGAKRTDIWKFTPKCSTGACSVGLTYRYGHASDVFRAPHVQRVALRKSGSTYSGSARTAPLECGLGNEVAGTLTVTIRVTRGSWIDGVWRAKRFTGTTRFASPAVSTGIYRCSAARYTSAVSGSLED